MRIFMFLLMVLIHMIVDFNLQGHLSTWKQRSWWEKNYPDKLYENDWKICLNLHAFEWGIAIMMPYFVRALFFSPIPATKTDEVMVALSLVAIVNSKIHAYIDDKKCNKKSINLTLDQTYHILQLLVTAMICESFIDWFS